MMTAALATPDQVRAIHVARKRSGLVEDALYREALKPFGVVSSKELTAAQAATFLDRLNGGSRAVERPSRSKATGPFAKKLQALWLAGWNLGIVRDKHDTAMLAFVERQTKGIPHTRFLRDPKDAEKAIEALKSWLARDAGVAWPSKAGPGAVALKRAVVVAQYARLDVLAVPVTWAPFDRLTPGELDALSNRLGREIRAAISRRAA